MSDCPEPADAVAAAVPHHPKVGEVDLSGMRIPYNPALNAFLEGDLAAREPIAQFKEWFDQVCRSGTVREPNAVALATSTQDGKPSCRMVLLKGFGNHGFHFYTNYESRKGVELAHNPQAALTFYWDGENRSVRIEGVVERLSEEESSGYFHVRPLGSQVAASVSHQSTVVPSRAFLADQADTLLAQVAAHSERLPKPAFWGGYNLVPHTVEFWQGQTNRLHDRIRFRRPFLGEVIDPALTHVGDDGWVFERLAP
ncbi:Pyridoxine-5'-phosphate oxidase [Hypsibius exemplaris]|uniref:pyridoxal 5'-phosphate synthase n=1 Tax=Hypsibius exemplaris TaxID=2072580 RepID=A0A9X6N9P3_HYPEX|nr:Pyridoxine-5'-phosphate oxidase [Hypsibius exemplaris]